MPLYDSIKGEAEGLLLDYDIGIKGESIEIMKRMCEDKKIVRNRLLKSSSLLILL